MPESQVVVPFSSITRGEIEVCDVSGLTDGQVKTIKRHSLKITQVESVSIVRGTLFATINLGDVNAHVARKVANGVVGRLEAIVDSVAIKPHSSRTRSERRRARQRGL